MRWVERLPGAEVAIGIPTSIGAKRNIGKDLRHQTGGDKWAKGKNAPLVRGKPRSQAASYRETIFDYRVRRQNL
jgi:hypothetical protein